LKVVAVHSSPEHRFSKEPQLHIELVQGCGVRGDAHFGFTVKHRSRVAKDPSQPNLRQVHLLHEELFSELRGAGFQVSAGDMGENVTTRGVNLRSLSLGTKLLLGGDAIVEVTGLRNPCSQIEAFRSGLLAAVLERSAERGLVRKAGVMAVVVKSGTVRAEDRISVVYEPSMHVPLRPV
jgi:MOSC domain-containing protein YiiM